LDQCNSVLVGTSVYLHDRLQSVLNATDRLVYSRRTSEHTTPNCCYGSFTGYASRNESSSGYVFWHTIVCMAQHWRTCLDSLQSTSEIVGRRCLRSADTTTLQVTSTCRATFGDCAFPVAAAHAWNSLPLETRACSSLLTFRRETKSHLFCQSYG